MYKIIFSRINILVCFNMITMYHFYKKGYPLNYLSIQWLFSFPLLLLHFGIAELITMQQK